MRSKQLIKRLKTFFSRADEQWNEGAAKSRPGEVSCRSGCFGCCVGLFEISVSEALLALDGVARLAPDERRQILERSRRIVSGSASAFPGDPEMGVLDPERTEAADDAYFDGVADKACPMLELPSGRCRIYEERPITCRTYGLAWKRDGEVIHPACELNFTESAPDRQRETGIDLDTLEEADQLLAEIAYEAGLPAGAETTLAHAIVGSAFDRL
jgi:Fe-S-cluster containining protein